jgi:hypothetical protein
MLLVVLYLLFICIFFYFVAPLKNDKKVNNDKKVEQFTSEKLPDLHYVKGFIIPEPAYKADTNAQDRFMFDIHGKVRNSKAKNVHQLFNEITNDNYNLFNNLNKLIPNESSKKSLYQNLNYNPKTETQYIFKNGIPKMDYEDRKNFMPQKIKIDYSLYKNKTTY